MRRSRAFLVIVAAIVLLQAVPANALLEFCSVTGIVTEASTGQVLDGVKVSYPGRATFTAADGTYSLRLFCPTTGAYVTAAKAGYRSQTKNTGLMLLPGESARLDFALQSATNS